MSAINSSNFQLDIQNSEERPTVRSDPGQAKVAANRRLRRDDDPGPDANGELKLLHAPCEFDLIRFTSIDNFPRYCQPVYQNRFVNEEWYRLYRTYDTEGFVFGQFYERLKRHEVD
ncbi:hypothetical protein KR018_003326 [Drosophila ironensis]|nr:hypothetical protein KR018_003326 [Drosophila ironensis]